MMFKVEMSKRRFRCVECNKKYPKKYPRLRATRTYYYRKVNSFLCYKCGKDWIDKEIEWIESSHHRYRYAETLGLRNELQEFADKNSYIINVVSL